MESDNVFRSSYVDPPDEAPSGSDNNTKLFHPVGSLR